MTNYSLKALLLVLALFLSSCGYETAKRGVKINDEVYSNIAIPTFHNVTYVLGVEGEVTQFLRKNVINSGEFDLTSREEADIVLHGEVTSLGKAVLALNTVGSATEYRLSMSIKFNLKQNSSGKEIYEDTVSGTWDFKYMDNTIDNRITEDEATTNLSNQLARDILLLVKERFSHNSRND